MLLHIFRRDNAGRRRDSQRQKLAAMDEVDEMIRTGKGEHFEGSTADFFAQLAAEG